MTNQRECAMVKGGDWYTYFWKCKNIALRVSPKAWKELNEVFDAMYDGGKFFKKYLPKKGKTFLGLGVGYGGIELVLASRGWRGLGIDNNRDALFLASQNARILAPNHLMVCYTDLYDENQFPGFFEGKDISACLSFGVMEHFKPEEIPGMIQRQFLIAPLVICMVPVSTKGTLKFFGASDVGPHVETKSGIYRVLQTSEWWEKKIFSDSKLLAVHHSRNDFTGVDMTTFVTTRREK